MTRRDRIKAAAAAAARTFCDEFPGQAPDDNWATTAYEYDTANLRPADGSYGDVYWPTFEAMVNAINKRRAQQPRIRRPRSVMSPRYHTIKVVIEVTGYGTNDECRVAPILRSIAASISGTGLEMTGAQALKAIYKLQEELRGTEAQVEAVATEFGLGGG